jgi:hypothetical protein
VRYRWLNLVVKLAKEQVLHDGKVPDAESDLPHALLGMQWAEKYGKKKRFVMLLELTTMRSK